MLKAAPPVSRPEAMMHLSSFKNRLYEEDQLVDQDGSDVNVTGVTSDSREVEEGDLFLAVRGCSDDGHAYIEQALDRGAVAVVGEEKPASVSGSDPFLYVRDSRISEGFCADEFYGRPSDDLTVIGVTGTNGKTTTTRLIHSLLNAGGDTAGRIGTIENRVSERVIPSDRTTPPPCQMHSLLERMRDQGCSYAVLEVSSHGLDQKRVAGVDFDAAVFTNLSRDHLDYHGTMDAYASAKARLFALLTEEGLGVVNADDPYGERMIDACSGRVVTYGRTDHGEAYHADVEQATMNGTRWTLSAGKLSTTVDWSLTGTHNVENALAAATAVHQLTGRDIEAVGDVLAAETPVNGRLDPVEWDGDFHVLVDYAHTPDALENVLDAVRPLVRGQIRAVFGCGGDRDRGKRPLMGETVYERADEVYVTSDNPRSEDPMRIIEDILDGIEDPDSCHVDPEREQAIERAIADASAGDAVLIFGKGHETVQKKDGVVRPFKDGAVAEEILCEQNE